MRGWQLEDEGVGVIESATHHFCEPTGCYYPSRVDEPVEKPCLEVKVSAKVVLDVFVYSSGNESGRKRERNVVAYPGCL